MTKPTEKAPITTVKAVAALLGVDRRTVSHWRRDRSDFPKPDAEGEWDADELLDWRAVDLANRPDGDSPDARRLLKARADEREAKARLAALELERTRAAYLPAAEVKQRDRVRVAAVRRGLAGLAKRLASRVVGLDVRQAESTIRTEVRRTLTNFSQS